MTSIGHELFFSIQFFYCWFCNEVRKEITYYKNHSQAQNNQNDNAYGTSWSNILCSINKYYLLNPICTPIHHIGKLKTAFTMVTIIAIIFWYLFFMFQNFPGNSFHCFPIHIFFGRLNIQQLVILIQPCQIYRIILIGYTIWSVNMSIVRNNGNNLQGIILIPMTCMYHIKGKENNKNCNQKQHGHQYEFCS